MRLAPSDDPTELGGVKLEHRHVLNGDVRLHVVTAGVGPPIVLLHGFPEHWWSWRHQIPALVRAGFSVWVPDLRGYHRSDRPHPVHAYELRHLVDDVVALVRATGAARAHIAGHDWGGIIAWTLAGHRPEVVDRLVILNAPHLDIYVRTVWRTTQAMRSAYVPFFALPWLPEQALSAGRFFLLRTMMRRLAVRKDALGEDDVERYVDALSRPGALRAALAYYRVNVRRGPMTWARASRVVADTLVIWGLDDPALSPVLLDGLDAVAPNSRIHRVPACGHWVQAEAAAEVNGAMVTFLGATTDTVPASTAAGERAAARSLR
jgi:pimeloyl-ACP methyl ester carboxylesterase